MDEKETEAVARVICQDVNRIMAVDLDGGANWFMFEQQAKELLAQHPHIGGDLVRAAADYKDALNRVLALVGQIKSLVKPVIAPTAGSGEAS